MTRPVRDAGDEPTLETMVAEIARRWPRSADALARLGIDSCCGGSHSLGAAARAHGLDPRRALDEVLAAVRGSG